MAKCNTICASELNTRITIYSRNLLPSSQIFDQDPTQSLTIVAQPWAKCQTGQTFKKGDTVIDGIQTDLDSVTHKFTIRFSSLITSEMKILHKSKHYDIVAVENVDEDDKVLYLFARLQGDSSKGASLV